MEQRVWCVPFQPRFPYCCKISTHFTLTTKHSQIHHGHSQCHTGCGRLSAALVPPLGEPGVYTEVRCGPRLISSWAIYAYHILLYGRCGRFIQRCPLAASFLRYCGRVYLWVLSVQLLDVVYTSPITKNHHVPGRKPARHFGVSISVQLFGAVYSSVPRSAALFFWWVVITRTICTSSRSIACNSVLLVICCWWWWWWCMFYAE